MQRLGKLQFMVLVTSNTAKQLLCICYIERVRLGDLERSRKDIEALIAELGPGFRLLTDLSRLESMDLDCATELGNFMELFDRSGVSMVVRVIPDPKKDIGLNILALFHYRKRPQFISYQKMSQAAKHLSL